MIWNLANSSSTLIDESTKLTSHFVKSDGYRDVVIDLDAMGALDSIRAAKYDASDWSDLTAEQLEAEISYFDGYMSANTDLTSTQDIAIVSENDDGSVTDSIFIPTGIDLLAINDVTNEYNPRAGILTRRAEKETVTVSSNAATTLKNGTGNCMLFDSDGIAYDGTITNKAVSVTAADGEYTIIYELLTEETVYYYPQDITCFENGTMYLYTDRKQDIGYYGSSIMVEDAAKPVESMISCSKIDIQSGNLVPIDISDITVAEDGLSFTISGASSGDYYEYTYQYDTVNRAPLTSFIVPVNIKAAINSNRDTIQTIKYQTNTDRALLDSLNKTVNQIGTEDTETNIVNIDNIEYYGYRQKPDMEIYGTTLVNLLGSYGNFEFDTNADGLADGWTNDAALSAVANAINTSTELFGSSCQKITLSADGEGGNYIEVSVAAAQKLFVSGYIRAGDTSTTSKLIVDWRDNTDTQISTDTVGTRAVASYARVSAVLTAPANTVKARIYATVAGVSGKLAYFDGVEVVNLTTQGALDPVRQSKYGVSNWSDLTEAQLEAEIPYFDSVLSVNVEDGTASELTVENRGKNLILTYLVNPSGVTVSKNENSYNLIWSDGFAIFLSQNQANGFIKVKPNTDYVFSATKSGSNIAFIFSDIAFNYISDPLLFTSNNRLYKTFNSGENSIILIRINRLVESPTGNVNVSDFQLEEGSVATDYVPPREDSITIPDTCELHGYNGAFNYIDSNGNYTKNWEREDKTTDVSGAFSLSGYASGSKVICRNKTTGQVEVLDAAASVTTSWTEESIEILYQLETPVESIEEITGTGLMILPGHNNILSPDSKAPCAIRVATHKNADVYNDLMDDISNLQTMLEDFESRLDALEA